MKTKNLLRMSFFINVILLLSLCSFFYVFRTQVKDKYLQITIPEPTEEYLLNFNPREINICYQKYEIGSDSTITIQFIGNSICRHGVVDYWDSERGMASSSEEKDYVHQIVKMVAESKNVNVSYSISSIFDFERNFYNDKIDWVRYVDDIKFGEPDYLIVQIGENTKQEYILKYSNTFKDNYIKILSLFPNSYKIITTPFWQRNELNYLYEDIAISSGSALCDISHLGIDMSNQALSEENGLNKIVLTHPGDFGMENIAKCIFSIINAGIK